MNIEGIINGLPVEELSFRGDEAYFLCPFHDDRRAGSFSVSLATGAYFCFACGAKGGLPRLVAKVKGVTPAEARQLTRRVVTELEPVRRERADTTRVINEASLALFDEPPKAALAKRRISQDAAEVYEILWNKGSWIFPIREPDSNVLMGWQEKEDGVRFRNYPRGVEKSRTLYGLEHARRGGKGQLILVESPLDAARLLTAGFPGAVASYGVQVSRRQVFLLRSSADRLVLALDNDSDGVGATAALLSEMRSRRPRVFSYAANRRAKDPGEMTDEEIAYGMANPEYGSTDFWREEIRALREGQ